MLGTLVMLLIWSGCDCAGCVVPELLNGTNHVPWFEAGATIFSKKGIQYLGIPGLINARSILLTLVVQVCFETI